MIVMCLLPLGAMRAEGERSAADEELEALLELQHELLGRAAMAAYQEEVEALRPRVQTLVFDYERFLRNNPRHVDGMVAYSMLLGSRVIDERERAEALLLKANALDPNRAVVKNQLGKYIAEDGRPIEALNYFLAAVELEPEQALYHFQVGQLLGAARDDFLRSGEWTPEQIDAALMHALEEAVRLDSDNFAYAYRLAEAHYDVAEPDWEAALAAWQALAMRAEDPLRQGMVRLHEANVLLAMERLEDAAAVLETGAYEKPLEEQRDALLAKLERLREGPAAAAQAAPKPAPATARPAVNVPEFKTGEVDGLDELNASAVVEIAKQLPAELPTAPLGEAREEAAPQDEPVADPAAAESPKP